MKFIRSKYSLNLLNWLDFHQPPGTLIMMATSLVVGLTAGVGVWLFQQLIDISRHFSFDIFGGWLSAWGGWAVLLLPVIGGLFVGIILHNFVGEERHHGVAGIMESVALAGGRLRYRRMPFKVVAAALSIGSGASVGPEDPSVQIGANLGSMFGQWLHLSDERVQTLVAAGSAAGIAAAFNAPIAGVFFALEIVLGEISSRALGVVLLSSVFSAVFTQAVRGVQPAFGIPAYTINSAWEFLLYIGLGLFAGPIGAWYVKALYVMGDFFHRLHVPLWVKPALGGLAVGVVGIFLPEIFGVGYETVEIILNGKQLALTLLLALLAAKLLLTAVSIGAGFPGGVFAPSLFLGATLGSAYGLVMSRLFPGLGITPQAYAMGGMAAVLVSAVHSPLTAIILLFEMTNDYRIILPLMLAVTVSLIISQRLQEESVYTLGLLRKGLRIQHGRDVEVLEGITVNEVMDDSLPAVNENEPVADVAAMLMKLHTHGLAVVNNISALVGIITLQDIDKTRYEESGNIKVGDICSRDVMVAYPDETVGHALRRMSIRGIGRMPVVPRDNPKKLVGMLRRAHVIKAYNVALSRRAALRHQAQKIRLGAFTHEDIQVEEVMVEAGSICAGKLVRSLALPHDCVVATIRRHDEVIIPRGDTSLQPGDTLIMVADGSDTIKTARGMCQAPPQAGIKS